MDSTVFEPKVVPYLTESIRTLRVVSRSTDPARKYYLPGVDSVIGGRR